MMERKRQIEGKGRSFLSGWKEQHRCSHTKSWVGDRPGEDSCELQMGRGVRGVQSWGARGIQGVQNKALSEVRCWNPKGTASFGLHDNLTFNPGSNSKHLSRKVKHREAKCTRGFPFSVTLLLTPKGPGSLD